MAENQRLSSFEDLPSHLILKILIYGGLSVMDLVNIELTSKLFGLDNEVSSEFKSVADQAASRLCSLHPIFVGLSPNHQKELLERCNRNWKRVLRFLQSMVGSCGSPATSKEKIQTVTGHNYSVIKNSMIYFCGSNDELGNFAHGPVDLPYPEEVVQVSAMNNKVAYVTDSGEVFTCARAEFDPNLAIYKPKLVEAMRRIPCKQVEIGLDFTVFLSKEGHVYTVGENRYGQLGHGDTKNRHVPKMVKGLEKIVQISVGALYVLALTEDGTVYWFGDYCLHDKRLQHKLPQAIETFKTKDVHILSVSAGAQHAAAIDSNGYVYTWGRRNPGVVALGPPDMSPTPEVLDLKNHLAVQVCAANMSTFVVVESGSIFRIL